MLSTNMYSCYQLHHVQRNWRKNLTFCLAYKKNFFLYSFTISFDFIVQIYKITFNVYQRIHWLLSPQFKSEIIVIAY